MSPSKVLAFLLGLAGIAGVLFAGLMATGPFLISKDVSPPPLLAGAGPGCLALMLFAVGAPLLSVPGLLGLGLWALVVRKQDDAATRELLTLPERELDLQVRLDGVTRRLAEPGADAANLELEIPRWMLGLDPQRQRRLLRFLSQCGLNVPGRWPDPPLASSSPEHGNGCVRVLALGLIVFAALCLLWSFLTALTHLTTDPLRPLKIESGPNEALFGSLGCLIPGITAALGGLGLKWMLWRATRRQRQSRDLQDHVRQVVSEGCFRRIERILGSGTEDIRPLDEAAARMAQAELICSLSELDGLWKGRLMARLHMAGLLSRLSPRGLDLQGVVLAGMDLSAVALVEANLSGAFLGRACLVRANLHGSRLQAADLSSVEAGEANLRHANLRGAKLHRSNLQGADLSFAELQGANLWQADLTRADLSGARVTTEQLAAARTLAGATLPEIHETL